ncbi:MAG: hypothetical protein ACOCSL_03335 [Thermoplasmatota archaeon]
MEKLKDKVSSKKMKEAWKIGIALILFGILILSSFLFVNLETEDYCRIENTYYVINRAIEFLGVTFIFTGIVLIALSVFDKFTELKKT